MDCKTFIETCKSMGFIVADNEKMDGYDYDVRIISNNNPLGNDPFTVAYFMKQTSEEHAYVAVFCGCDTYHLGDGAISKGKRFIADNLSVDELKSALEMVLVTIENVKTALEGNKITLKQLYSLYVSYESIADNYPIMLQCPVKKLLSDLEVVRLNKINTPC